MKLDISHVRYLTGDDFKVLKATEQGTRNHELVPTSLIHQLSGMRSISGTNRCIADLAKLKLISKMRNAKYEGYTLSYNGFDYLALKSLLNKGVLYSVGNMIGVGKESDVYQVSNRESEALVMKMHRLGRTSFHTVKNNRDYLKKNQSASWMGLSRLAAEKEYQFMSMLYTKGFSVPRPYENSRHVIVMEYIKGFPMRRLRKHNNISKLYRDLMNFIVRLACHGLIHCDFNEFNIMIKYEDESDGGFVVIDFPQCISIQHSDAEYYFQRDVECIRRFFKKKLKYEPKPSCDFWGTDGYGDGYKYPYPVFSRDVKRLDNLDELLMASGFSKKHPSERALEASMQRMRDASYSHVDSHDKSEYSDIGDSDASSSESEGGESEETSTKEENEKIVEALSNGVGSLKMDKLGNYIL